MNKPYQVNWSWNKQTNSWLRKICIGYTLNICCGMSNLGHIRVDIDPAVNPDLICDVHFSPFRKRSFDTVICDPPFSFYNKFKWILQLSDLAKKRLILSHGVNSIKLNKRVWKKQIYGIDQSPGLFLRFFSIFDRYPTLPEFF